MKQQLHFFLPDRNLFWKILLIFATVSLLFCSLSGKGQSLGDAFQIHGTVDIKKQEIVYLMYYSNTEEKAVADSCKIIDGYFSFKGSISVPAVAFIKLNRERTIDDQTAIMFLEPVNMKIKLSSDPFAVVMISGSYTHFEYDSLNEKKKVLHEKYEKVIEEFEKEKKDELKIKLDSYYEGLKQLDYSFFAAHPQSFVTGYLLQSYYRKLSVDSLQMYYSNMNDALRKSIYGIQLKEVIQKRKVNISGQKAADFRSITYNNKIISLSEFKGRYVILDFWAHWCVPCRQSFPRLKALFNKYHEKGLDIIGVADDDFKQNAWKKAIENDKIGIWYNVLRGLKKNNIEEIDKTQSINDKFNVQVLPTRILIDQKGMIIGRYEGTEGDDKLEKKLREIFE